MFKSKPIRDASATGGYATRSAPVDYFNLVEMSAMNQEKGGTSAELL